MEGFNTHFLVRVHHGAGPDPTPKEGSLIHPFDELLVFAGIDHTNIRYLGAEVSVELGQGREEHVFDKAGPHPRGQPTARSR